MIEIRNFTLLISLLFVQGLCAQTLMNEDFEGGMIPIDWNNISAASDGGWRVGAVGPLSSNGFGIPSNGSTSILATNDDQCNCDKSNDFISSAKFDLSGIDGAVLNFDILYTDNSYQGIQEDASLEISIDNGVNWELLSDLEGETGWRSESVDLGQWIGNAEVQIGFRYNDNGGWLYGCAIDNISVNVPAALEVALSDVKERSFGEVGTGQKIETTIYNAGSTEITSLKFDVEVDDGTSFSETLDNISIPSFATETFILTEEWNPAMEGTFEVMVTLSEVNGTQDENQANNIGFYSSQIYGEVIVPNKMEEYISQGGLEINEITGATSLLDGPTDLDFFPIAGRDELWVINRRTENIGGSTVTISDATDVVPSNFNRLVDGNAWHFMSLPTAIAFSDDNFNFANSPGVQDANHGGGTFTGPSLWSSDLAIYAQPSGGNGSHLDMLHGSPFSMGIAHEKDNVFWLFDDYNSDIVRYDFAEDHGPGADDHSDGIVRRFSDIGIKAKSRSIPNHMKLDKSSGWLYFVDSNNGRVMRLDINSASGMSDIPLINEPLAEHSRAQSFTVEQIIGSNLDTPCGLEIFENRLIVGDYATGNIHIYDMDNEFAELVVLPTFEEGLAGIVVGPDGNIWYTNMLENTLNVASPDLASSTNEFNKNLIVNIIPNPSRGEVQINVPSQIDQSKIDLQVSNVAGEVLMLVKNIDGNQSIDFSDYSDGIYFLTFKGEKILQTERLVIQR